MMIAGYRKVIAEAHARHLPVVAATIPPYARAYYHDSNGEAVRLSVNNWIRTSAAFDAVADLDEACATSDTPPALSLACDGGDGLHLSDGGYALVADKMDEAIMRLPTIVAK